ncbi:LysR family transcriptional regulator [Komagataeibacter sp. AV436]|uniref:LysR family transcriptional regulator n=1 Tax=Komagataeibacter melomenusus TaxID=2766578 RepID=A0ABX2AFK3_9PROT|nr:LysR family transcriptional regulator [Komagataeibacter melomenusus]MBV1829039.1 LysR family transcriptional regulator [Komagataeibacter melomenusus]NPC67099.1 LysR family transcriptional regulator [Komagataeibacter melomenusus]
MSDRSRRSNISVTSWDLDGRILQYFLTVIAEGSIRGAAERLNIAASAISRQIGDLEYRCGLKLLERKPRGVIPTTAGRALADFARTQHEDSERLLNYFRTLHGQHDGIVRICCAEGLAEDIIEHVLPLFRQEFPRTRLQIQGRPASDIANALLEGRADMGLTYDLVPCQGIRSVLCASQPISVVVHAGHEWLDHTRIRPRHLATRPLALLSENHALRRRLQQMESDAGVCFQPILETEDISTLRNFVMSGQGISLLPHFAVHQQARAGAVRAIPFDNMPLCITTHVIARVQRDIDPRLESLLGLLADHHPALQPPADYVTRLSA